jgi:predicted small metal-binding protein
LVRSTIGSIRDSIEGDSLWGTTRVGHRRHDVNQDARTTELVVACDCGFEARGKEQELIPIVKQHGFDVHNMTVTDEQVLAMARPA